MKKLALILVGIVIVLGVVMLLLGRMYPPINDISTTRDDSLNYVAIASQNSHRDYSYNSTFSDVQKKHYPDIRPVVVERNSSAVFDKAVEIAKKKGWKIVEANKAELRIEAVAQTSLLKFKDDVLVKMESLEENRTLIQMRSKSRLGKADFGANAKRIRSFLAEILRSIHTVEEAH